MTPRVLGSFALAVALTFSTAACGGEPADRNSAEVPAASGDLEGQDYKDVVSDLKKAGFTSVETEIIPDLVTGWLTSDGEVESVKIGGQTEFEDGERFETDVAVVVSYPQDEEDEEQPSEAPVEQETDEPTPTETAQPDVVTSDNAELAALLRVRDNCDDRVAKFANKYEGQTISFDGSVQNVLRYGSFDTRFNFLVGPGDFDPNHAIGPTFQFRDKNFYDMNVTGKQSGRLGTGDNATFTAEAGEYNTQTCLFQLEPVETNKR